MAVVLERDACLSPTGKREQEREREGECHSLGVLSPTRGVVTRKQHIEHIRGAEGITHQESRARLHGPIRRVHAAVHGERRPIAGGGSTGEREREREVSGLCGSDSSVCRVVAAQETRCVRGVGGNNYSLHTMVKGENDLSWVTRARNDVPLRLQPHNYDSFHVLTSSDLLLRLPLSGHHNRTHNRDEHTHTASQTWCAWPKTAL